MYIRKFFILLFLILTIHEAIACDICGCGSGNFYMGLLPSFKSRFFGIRYHFMQYNTSLVADPTQFSHNNYNSLELWTGWNLGKKWQVLGFIPYYFNKQADDDGVTYKNGLGDITVMANYQLYQTPMASRRINSVWQELWIGGGIKLPTGSFSANTSDPDLTIADINAQIGTGSVDFLLNLNHYLHWTQFGLNTVINYKLNTSNGSDYKYGNRFAATSILSYQIKAGKIQVVPNVGLLYEHTAANQLQNQKVNLTGGYLLGGIAGLEVYVNRVAVGFNLQGPFSQDLADGQTNLRIRGMAHITYVF
jgi:hypothetical protein